ncbi:hypothetical protein M378DRAFT_323035 [Amanita muscaria Koide BX008]|uniref:SAPS-domain-containing protein n=1 Tax=Amanita muscaria (strain Koide BX008) TaxID=946122 RepID=A0A0C2XDW0_AMAMK|nr:hypothetical protein M378DRAFT_323035 [Amanita muscaria Koide BX008]
MFWRFGFHNGSAIDSLLDKEDVSLEAILDEDDLLQECKSQNTRLIDYFQLVDVLQRLFGYVTGQIEGEEKQRFKYPYVATEVLCSEIWSIVETCIREQNQLLVPFWETVLDRSAEDMKTQMVMASHFAKIISVFLSKKPAEMLSFIQDQPSVVEKFLRHIETPAFVDLLIRIIQLDEHPEGAGVLEWLSSQNFIGRLLDLLAPHHTSDVHTVVAELIKTIITMATPSPGAGISDGHQNGPASNRFARELAQKDSVMKLMSYILYDFGPGRNVLPEDGESGTTEDLDHSSSDQPPLPTLESATSSVTQSISIIIELIRKNNSDYFEPYLFHSVRNRLIQIQQHLHMYTNDGREELEHAMQEMVDRMGVVHFGPLLEIMCDRMGELQELLKSPRSLTGPLSTTVGEIMPLTLERYRICELFAELLHCSNMSMLNRPPEYNRLYDAQGRLQGGLAALEGLAQVIASNQPGDRDRGVSETIQEDEVEPALELPVHGASRSSPIFSSDEDISSDDGPGSSDEDAMEEIAMFDEPQSMSPPAQEPIPLPSPHSPETRSLQQDKIPPGSSPLTRTPSRSGEGSPVQARGSRRSSRRTLSNILDTSLYIGEQLKRRLIDKKILPTFLGLFFEFPWNNFLHSAVYDLIHQILTGNVVSGNNRELAIALFRDARLIHRIVEGQRQNDSEIAKPKGVRLGYMGHLTLISEDVIAALERYPTDLRDILLQYAPVPEWDEYVSGRYNETKRRDSSLLGGGKPALVGSTQRAWQVIVEDGEFAGGPGGAAGPNPGFGGPGVGTSVGLGGAGALRSAGKTVLSENGIKGEFKRAPTGHPLRAMANTADFGSLPGPARFDEDEDEDTDTGGSAPRFATYLAQEMQNHSSFGSSSSDSDEEEGGWLSHSQFALGPGHPHPPVSVSSASMRHIGGMDSLSSGERRHPLRSGGSEFDDAFDPLSAAGMHAHTDTMGPHDPFNSSDDDFGPFADTNAASGDDPFTFSSSFSDEMEDGSFDSFGEFGEFQNTSIDVDDAASPGSSGSSGSGGGTSVGGARDTVSRGTGVLGELDLSAVGGPSGGPGLRGGGADSDLTPTTTGSWTFEGDADVSEDGRSPSPSDGT